MRKVNFLYLNLCIGCCYLD